MIKDAFDRGVIDHDTLIIEPTSGNTGIGLAALCASLGMRIVLTMPETMSIERRRFLKAYGAEIVLTDGHLGMIGAVERAKDIAAVTENSFIPSQFDNKANPNAHYMTTAREIYDDLSGNVSVIAAGVGTGGTVSGIGKFFKEHSPSVQILAVEPAESPVLKGGEPGAHGIQGIGANFIPGNFDASVVDETVDIDTETAIEFASYVPKCDGVFVGISSGAALAAAVAKGCLDEFEGKNIVAVFPDSGDRYLSTKLVGD